MGGFAFGPGRVIGARLKVGRSPALWACDFHPAALKTG
eukprot:CAMPEP_0180780570 /NCGR_PEP_ID=MMETSP1038_2-20121128/47086_1 /TAXON_ID=632150 /ORGANISM="Azadinium spinosum, Strain 3D9" /LENGTH=37 /DNA_ID= /DNA_START= /DNA_END= /DNA_ORIENTATION=